jgi:1-acyl-sn-glycerol-3-phosphate acyltransferase
MPPRTTRLVRAFRWVRVVLHVAWGLWMTTALYPRYTSSQRAECTQRWSGNLLRILNIRLARHGLEPLDRPIKQCVVANHISWLDIFVINAACPARFVAKAEIRNWPIAGVLCERAGTLFIERSRRHDTARINAEIDAAFSAGDTVAIFPEGTTTAGDALLKFHASLLEPAVRNSALVQPVALRYASPGGETSIVAAFIDDTTFAQSMGRIIATPELYAEITFAPPIAATGQSRRDLALAAENAIAAILDVPQRRHQPAPSREATVAEAS